MKINKKKFVTGAHDLNHPTGKEQHRNVKRMIKHPSYGRLNNDIALIELDRPVMFNDHIQPVCLPDSQETPSVGSKCFLTGAIFFTFSFYLPNSLYTFFLQYNIRTIVIIIMPLQWRCGSLLNVGPTNEIVTVFKATICAMKLAPSG